MPTNIKIMSGLVSLNKKLILILNNQIKSLIIKKFRSKKLRIQMMGKLKFRHVNLKGKIIQKVHSLLLERVKSEEERNLERVSFKIKKNNSDLEIEIKIQY